MTDDNKAVTPATDDVWCYRDRAANDEFIERCRRKVIELMPFVYTDVGMLIARIDALKAENERLRSAAPSLVEAVKLTLDVLNSWGAAKDDKRTPTPLEWAAYQCMIKGNYIDLAVRLRAALAETPKEARRGK